MRRAGGLGGAVAEAVLKAMLEPLLLRIGGGFTWIMMKMNKDGDLTRRLFSITFLTCLLGGLIVPLAFRLRPCGVSR